MGLAFQNLKPGDPLCRLFVDTTVAYNHTEDGAEDRDEQESVPFLKAVWARYVRACQQGEDMAKLDLKLCDYHEHANDEEREACEKERRDTHGDKSDDSDHSDDSYQSYYSYSD
jgi:hypothetical protein